MIICCLGDSLTEGDYGIKGKTCIANVHEKNYPYFLAKLVNAEVRNFGKCGFTSSLYLNYYKSGEVNVKDADIIIIMLGTNGGMTPYEDTEQNKDYYELIELLEKDSKGKIYLCTPPHVTSDKRFIANGFGPTVEKASIFVRETAKKYNLSLIDVAKSDRITAEHEDEYQGNDGVHFIEKGYEVLAEEIYKGLKLN